MAAGVHNDFSINLSLFDGDDGALKLVSGADLHFSSFLSLCVVKIYIVFLDVLS
ncbi:hypothetical protein D3C81_2242500 [compost metagenome]